MSTRPRENENETRRRLSTLGPSGECGQGRIYTGAVVHVDRSHLACVPAVATGAPWGRPRSERVHPDFDALGDELN
jgi:hypothetical protein